MGRLQDKICNALTFVGLVGIIGFGTASMLPDTSSDLTGTEEEASATEETDEMPTDTLKEVFTAEETKYDHREEDVTDTVPLHTSTDTAGHALHPYDENEPHKQEHTPAAHPAEHDKPHTTDSAATAR